MDYASVASGIEAASVAFEKIENWKPVWFAQHDPEHNYKTGPDFPSAVLQHRFPHVPNLGDMTKLTLNPTFNETSFDLLVGGTPCQSFSVAGLRSGLDDERGNLTLEYARILMLKKPRWFLWENVPGVLSSGTNDDGTPCPGKDFACILSAFTGKDIPPQEFEDAGVFEGEFYSVAYRILNSQYFGVAQRRRRVFIVGYAGNRWQAPFAVLFEQDSLRRDFTPRKGTGQRVAEAITRSPYADRGEGGNIVGGEWPQQTAATLTADYGAKQGADNQHVKMNCPLYVPHEPSYWDGSQTSQTLDAVLHKGQTMPDKNRFPAVLQTIDVRNMNTNEDLSGTIQSKKGGHSLNYINPIVYDPIQVTNPTNRSNPKDGDPSYTLTKGSPQPLLVSDDIKVFSIDGYSSNAMKSFNPHSGIHEDTVSQTITAGTPNPNGRGGTVIVAPGNDVIPINSMNAMRRKDDHTGGLGIGNEGDPLSTLSKNHQHAVSAGEIVRRLTPVECERLQGFPDNWTNVPWKRKKTSPDSLRYQAIGNSMTTNVMHWIGKRIDMVDKILKSRNL